MKFEFDSLKILLVYNIKYYRYIKNVSQKKLVELSLFSPRYIMDIERELPCPSIDKLEALVNL